MKKYMVLFLSLLITGCTGDTSKPVADVVVAPNDTATVDAPEFKGLYRFLYTSGKNYCRYESLTENPTVTVECNDEITDNSGKVFYASVKNNNIELLTPRLLQKTAVGMVKNLAECIFDLPEEDWQIKLICTSDQINAFGKHPPVTAWHFAYYFMDDDDTKYMGEFSKYEHIEADVLFYKRYSLGYKTSERYGEEYGYCEFYDTERYSYYTDYKAYNDDDVDQDFDDIPGETITMLCKPSAAEQMETYPEYTQFRVHYIDRPVKRIFHFEPYEGDTDGDY